MFRPFMIAAAAVAVLTLSSTTFGQQASSGGTAAEAKAMLGKAVAAVKADKAKALDMFNKGEGGFKDRDLYVFCANASDGKVVAVLANPNAKSLIGTDQRTLKDSTGKAFGEELYAAAQKPEGQFTEVTYLFPRPATDNTPVTKISLVTRVSDLGCGVGYYPAK
jgi:signal transduction histidine kinase